MNSKSVPFDAQRSSALSAALGSCASSGGWADQPASASEARRATAPRPPWAARMLQRLLQQLQHGRLTVHWPDGQSAHYGPGDPAAHAEDPAGGAPI
ncbi:MAG: hypothetical protein Q7T22_06070, partial [Serpentinimonas sp.]|nr:hypothetical protein [Serpentinimonas sp.]